MSDWLPGAVQSPQPGGVTLDKSLPPRAVWHITWDALRPGGIQPQFSAVSNYLKTMEYCPHLMWNPFTGYIEQFYPATVGGRALKYNNQDGRACVQIEVFFTPGCVVNGKTYNTVAETPCVGLDRILAWTDSLGIPRTWPMGAPKWSGNSRDIPTWNGNAGHYGHCHSPGDDHTDPGPMPALTRTITPQSTPAKDYLDMVSQADWNALVKKVDAIPGQVLLTKMKRNGPDGNPDGGDVSLRDVAVNFNQTLVRVLDGITAANAKPSATVNLDAAQVQAIADQLKAALPPAVVTALAAKLSA